MREIKFRGKRVDNGEWIYGNLINKIKPTEVESTFWCSLIHDGALNAAEVIPETVGQFTGLTDKNGIEIFEGDKVRVDEVVNGKVKSWENEVCFKNGCFSLVNRNCCYTCKNGSGITCNLDEFNSICEVIGNIHDKTSQP